MQNVCLFQQNVGELKLLENENEVWRRISSGNRWPIQFQVIFPVSWPLPVLRSITSNGNAICIGDISRTYLYLTNTRPELRLCVSVSPPNIIALRILVFFFFLQSEISLCCVTALQLIIVLETPYLFILRAFCNNFFNSFETFQ
jgi:hypothetical protein